MNTELVIRWDGDVPGLQDHALSLDAWAGVLTQLLETYRRVASGILTDAKSSEYGGGGGRLHKKARLLDLRLTEIRDGCVQIHVSAEALGEQLDWDLAGMSLNRLVEHVGAEAAGQPSHAGVRKLLRGMPPGVSTQRWHVYRNGVLTAETEFGQAAPPTEPQFDLPHLERVVGRVSTVRFDKPGLVVLGDRRVQFDATPAQVEAAVALRQKQVAALGVKRVGGAAKLLWIRHSHEAGPKRGAAERTRDVVRRWPRTLEILAQ